MWKQYRKKNTQEMRPYFKGDDMTRVSVSPEDTPEVGGMIARNADNYNDQWYVAKGFFDNNYEEAGKTTGMSFGQAIEALKAGKKVARAGWNGKNMWLCLMPGFEVEEPNKRTQAHGITQPFECGAYIVMWTAQGVWQPGWLASQADMLAADWLIVE